MHTPSADAHACARPPPCIHMNQEHKDRPSAKRPTWGRSPCGHHLFRLCSLARHPGRTGRRPARSTGPISSSESVPLQLSPITPPGSEPQFILPRSGLQGHLREIASLSILGLRPSLLCVHSESRGARIPEARGLEPRRRASQGGVLPSS